MTANVQRMMYVGETPWHGLGTKLDKAATAQEAITAAGLDWKVNKQNIFTLINGKYEQVYNHFAIVREDTNQSLGVVGNVYKPLQNKEAFSFFDAVVGLKAAIYHTAGALGEGERVWILAKLPGEIRVLENDISEKFLLLTNRHDGTGCVQVMFTPIRVVCQNTLNIALAGTDTKASIRHTINMGSKVADVQKTLGIINQRFDIFEAASNNMAKSGIITAQFETYLKNIGLVTDTEKTRAKNIMEEVSELMETGKGTEIPGVRGSVWGAFNAVAEYIDHREATRKDENLDKRANSILFGHGATLKQRAWDQALVLAR